MKRFSFSILAAVALFAACNHEPATPPAELEISGLEITSGETLAVPGELVYNITITDDVDLSTLKVTAALESGAVLASAETRTPGQSAELTDQKLAVPFGPGMKQGANLVVSFEATNVDGQSVKQTKTVKIQRPQLPGTLYLTIGENQYSMEQDLENPVLYTTAEAEFESICTAYVSTSENRSESEFLWGASGQENVAAVIEFGADPVTVSYPSVLVSSFSFNAESFAITANGEVLDVKVNGTALLPAAGLLYANIAFEQGADVAISGISDIDNAWNRDFFAPNGDKFTFLRASGNYDVYYSPKYNYIWIAKMDAVAPECLWIVGHGFTEAPVFHDDFLYGGWGVEPITSLGYAVKVDTDIYQCSLYLNNRHEWGSFEFEIYSNLDWDKSGGFGGTSITGFDKGVKLSNAADKLLGLTSADGFQPGYYTIKFNNKTGEINLERHTEWVEHGGSGISINGTELAVGDDYYYANIYFETGMSIDFGGLDAEEINRDFFAKVDGWRFMGVSGTYKVQYYPAYRYMWLSNEEITYPDCLYILGSGKWAAPEFGLDAVWANSDYAYVRSAPYFVVAPKMADGTYKATMSMTTDNPDWRVLLEFYTDLWWNQSEETKPVEITGDAASRFYLNEEKGWFCGVDEKEDPFVPGNYQLIITTSASGASINVTKID